MAKQVLDLYELFQLVVARGGLVEVINKKLWREITKGLNLPSSITSAAFTLRTQYMKYLYPYECETLGLSTPNELQAAIDGNRREARRSSYSFDYPMMVPSTGSRTISPNAMMTAHSGSTSAMGGGINSVSSIPIGSTLANQSYANSIAFANALGSGIAQVMPHLTPGASPFPGSNLGFGPQFGQFNPFLGVHPSVALGGSSLPLNQSSNMSSNQLGNGTHPLFPPGILQPMGAGAGFSINEAGFPNFGTSMPGTDETNLVSSPQSASQSGPCGQGTGPDSAGLLSGMVSSLTDPGGMAAAAAAATLFGAGFPALPGAFATTPPQFSIHQGPTSPSRQSNLNQPDGEDLHNTTISAGSPLNLTANDTSGSTNPSERSGKFSGTQSPVKDKILDNLNQRSFADSNRKLCSSTHASDFMDPNEFSRAGDGSESNCDGPNDGERFDVNRKPHMSDSLKIKDTTTASYGQSMLMGSDSEESTSSAKTAAQAACQQLWAAAAAAAAAVSTNFHVSLPKSIESMASQSHVHLPNSTTNPLSISTTATVEFASSTKSALNQANYSKLSSAGPKKSGSRTPSSLDVPGPKQAKLTYNDLAGKMTLGSNRKLSSSGSDLRRPSEPNHSLSPCLVSPAGTHHLMSSSGNLIGNSNSTTNANQTALGCSTTASSNLNGNGANTNSLGLTSAALTATQLALVSQNLKIQTQPGAPMGLPQNAIVVTMEMGNILYQGVLFGQMKR